LDGLIGDIKEDSQW